MREKCGTQYIIRIRNLEADECEFHQFTAYIRVAIPHLWKFVRRRISFKAEKFSSLVLYSCQQRIDKIELKTKLKQAQVWECFWNVVSVRC